MKQYFTVFLFVLLSGFITAQVPTNGLIGYWPFNGNVNDESGNGNNGVVYGSTLTTDRFGNEESAYYFNGLTDYIEIELSNLLETSEISICAWIKTATIGNLEDGDWMDIISYGEDAHVIAIDENGHLLGGIQGTDESCEFPGDVIVSTDEWTFVTMTRNINNHVTLYLNGEEHYTDSCYYTVVFNHDYINFGRDPSWDEEYFEGSIDDILIYDRVLEITEIQELYNINTGITLSDKKKELNLYPNPVQSYVIINASGYFNESGYSIELVNILGQTIFKKAIDQKEYRFNVNEIGESGIYILRINDVQGSLIEAEKLMIN